MTYTIELHFMFGIITYILIKIINFIDKGFSNRNWTDFFINIGLCLIGGLLSLVITLAIFIMYISSIFFKMIKERYPKPPKWL